MTTKPVCRAAVDLVKHFEGLHLKAYLCPAGVPTIGYGHTDSVRLGQTITADQADAFMAADLVEAASHVDTLVKVPLNDDERGALSSFVFNLGAGSLASSTLLKLLNSGDREGAGIQFGRWVYASVNGARTQLPGLVARRAAEAALFSGQTAQAQAVASPEGEEESRIKRIQAIVGVTTSGVYDPVTQAAVTLWQSAHHLRADGIVGPITARAMGIP